MRRKAHPSGPGLPSGVTSAAAADQTKSEHGNVRAIMPDSRPPLGELSRRYPDGRLRGLAVTAVGRRASAVRPAPMRRDGRMAESPSPSSVPPSSKPTSVTAGTIMHGSKLPLTAWFWAACLIAAHHRPFDPRIFANANTASASTRRRGSWAPNFAEPWSAGPLAARRSRRGRRDGNPLAHQG